MHWRRPSNVNLIILTTFLALVICNPLALGAKDKIAVLVDADLYDDISVKFDRYVEEVESCFPVDLLVFNEHNWEGESPENIRDFIAGHSDYDGNIWDSSLATGPRCATIYGTSNVDTDGVGSDITYEADIKSNLTSVGYEIFDTWQHANSTLQAWDSGYMYSSEVMPLTNGSLMTFIYGCHSGDFWLASGSYSSNVNIATAYPFGNSIGQAATGTSWSYGTEYKYKFIEPMGNNDAYLGEAWLEMEGYVETRSFVQSRYPDRDPSGECAGNNLIGNPFLVVKNNWTGDSDFDGMPDWYEYRHKKPTVAGCSGLDRFAPDADLDSDSDGVSNGNEYDHGTDPTNPDTDGDGMPDGFEVDYDLDPLVNDTTGDPDEDGFSNYEEYLAGTNPRDFASAMRIASIERVTDPELPTHVIITWQSVPGKAYVIEYCDDPFDEPMDWIMCDGVWATSTTSTWTDSGGEQTRYVSPDDVPHRTYRIQLYVP